jgi:transposase
MIAPRNVRAPSCLATVANVPLLRMAIVERSDDMKGFVVLPRRWVVERTFAGAPGNAGSGREQSHRLRSKTEAS